MNEWMNTQENTDKNCYLSAEDYIFEWMKSKVLLKLLFDKIDISIKMAILNEPTWAYINRDEAFYES